MKTPFTHTVKNLLGEKCPNCRQGQVFNKNKRMFFNFPDMKATCDHCGYHFEREPGYFLGAMYASYGLAVLEGLSTFLLLRCFAPALGTLQVILVIVSVLLLCSVRNYRIGRMVWLYIFPQ